MLAQYREEKRKIIRVKKKEREVYKYNKVVIHFILFSNDGIDPL